MIRRSLGYYQGQPALFLESTAYDNRCRFVALQLEEAWLMCEIRNAEDFLKVLDHKTKEACRILNIQPANDARCFIQQMSKINDAIADGIDELIRMKPRTEETVKEVRYDVEPPKTIRPEEEEITLTVN